jgi:tetratricopeptide (TPR) repeat protein
VSNLLAGLLGALLATNQPAVVSNLVKQHTGLAVEVADPNDPVEKEYRKIMEEDDAAEAEVDGWIQESQKLGDKEASVVNGTLRPRMKQRFAQVRKRYDDFLQMHPNHVRARIAYGSFLDDIGEEEEACRQWEKAREIDPSQPAVWNNLANYYGHNGEVIKAFECYDKAIALSPGESVYYQNLATMVYMFRKDAQQHYDLTEPQIKNRVMALYRKALALDPKNFPLATELAQTFYGFKPSISEDREATQRAEKEHYEEALVAWETALKVARDEIEREGVYLHFARLNLMAGRIPEAERNLNLVTNKMYDLVKERLQKNLARRDEKGISTPPVSLRP